MIVAPGTRRALARIHGRGLEIGAFHSPSPVPDGARVTFVDAFPPEVARLYFEEVPADVAIVTPDIIAPAHALRPVASGSQDFVLASHLIEHLPDPIAGLREWHRVLRPGGLLFLAVPDMRATPDATRPRTALPHLLADHAEPEGRPERDARDFEHFRTWARSWNGLELPPQVEWWARFLRRIAYPIHFHCWLPPDVHELVAHLAAAGLAPFAVEEASEREDGYEFTLLLRALPA